MKTAILQSNPVTGDLEGNAKALLAAVRAAAAEGAELCIAPELALSGHNAGDLFLQAGFVARCRGTLNSMAATLHAEGGEKGLPPLLLGAPIANPVPQGKPLQSCAVFLHEGKVTVISRKVLLPSNGSDTEHHYFEPGVACGVLVHKGWRLAVTVGEDVWNDRTFWQDKRRFDIDPVAELMGALGADALINITALPYAQGLPAMHQRMLGWSAARYRVPVLVASLVGGNDALVYFGASFAFDSEGKLAAKAPAFAEAMLLVDLAAKGKGTIAPDPGPEEELWQAVVLGTRDFIRKCGFTKVVVGLSGGVDSALVAAIAVAATGPENVTGLLMPSRYSSAGSIDDSLELAKNLGITTHTLPISAILESYEGVFGAAFSGGLAGMAEENTQARIRGGLLMAYSNRFGALVLNTGNKSEEAVGYCTLYGDTVGGLAPIGDLYKHQVYALCRWYNSRHTAGIPEAILEKAPSAELRPDQKDSDSLPPYDVLDPLLYEIVENGLDRNALADIGYAGELTDRVLALVRGAEFKRHQAPPALKLTARGFGKGWRMPIAVGAVSK